MRSSIAVCVYLMVGGACGSPPEIKFGAVTEDGKAAIREWCKDLEMKSQLELVAGKPPLFESPNLLVMYCQHGDVDGDGYGWLAFDSTNNQLVNARLQLRQSNFDSIVNRVVVPIFDREQKAGYDELRAFLAKPTGTSKDWVKGKAYMSVEYIAQDPPNPHNIEPGWDISVGYRK